MTKALEAALTELSNVKDSFNEDDIERLFQNVYLELGYKTVGRDILGKRKSKKSGIPDVRLLNSDDSIQVIVELKKPAENLSDHENQLFAYMRVAESLTDKTARARALEKSIVAFPDSVTESLKGVHPELSPKGKSLPDRDDLARLVVTNTLPKTLSGKKVSEEGMLDGPTVLRIGKAELRVRKSELAKFAWRVLELRGTVDTQEFLALEVPINSKDQTRYLETLAAWEKEALALTGEIEKLEAELNEIVYEVYGLNAADREVIEEFLRRF